MATPLVAVIGPGRSTQRESDLAFVVGHALAEAGAVVLCGGLGGVMEAAARGAAMAGGRAVGLLPGTERADGNDHLDLALATGLQEARDGALVTAAGAVIAVGGNPGTLIEMGYAMLRDRPLAVVRGWRVVPGTGIVRYTDDPLDAVSWVLTHLPPR